MKCFPIFSSIWFHFSFKYLQSLSSYHITVADQCLYFLDFSKAKGKGFKVDRTLMLLLNDIFMVIQFDCVFRAVHFTMCL